MADLLLNRWPTFISSEVSDFVMISDILLPDSRGWNLVIVTQVFENILGMHVLFIVSSIHASQDVRVWRSSCTSRVVILDLYHLYREETLKSLDGGWIWRTGIHMRISHFL